MLSPEDRPEGRQPTVARSWRDHHAHWACASRDRDRRRNDGYRPRASCNEQWQRLKRRHNDSRRRDGPLRTRPPPSQPFLRAVVLERHPVSRSGRYQKREHWGSAAPSPFAADAGRGTRGRRGDGERLAPYRVEGSRGAESPQARFNTARNCTLALPHGPRSVGTWPTPSARGSSRASLAPVSATKERTTAATRAWRRRRRTPRIREGFGSYSGDAPGRN